MRKAAHSIFAALCMGACATAGATGPIWIMDDPVQGEDAKLCSVLLNRIRTLSTPEDCSDDAIETFPEFVAPPWQPLRSEQHRALIEKLLRYAQVGPLIYFDAKHQSESDERLYSAKANDFIADGGTLQVWRTDRLSKALSVDGRPPFAPRTLVQLSWPVPQDNPASTCPGTVSHGVWRSTFAVRDDLKEIERNINSLIAPVWTTGWLVLYKDAPLFINERLVIRDQMSVCSFSQSVGRE
jgi:hypothetical protein